MSKTGDRFLNVAVRLTTDRVRLPGELLETVCSLGTRFSRADPDGRAGLRRPNPATRSSSAPRAGTVSGSGVTGQSSRRSVNASGRGATLIRWTSSAPVSGSAIVAMGSLDHPADPTVCAPEGSRSLGHVADGLHVVAVGIADEGAVVESWYSGQAAARATPRPRARWRPRRGPDARPIGRGEGEVDSRKPSPESNLPIQKSGCPACRSRWPPRSPSAARHRAGQRRVVEGGAGCEVGALDAEVVDHGGILAARPTDPPGRPHRSDGCPVRAGPRSQHPVQPPAGPGQPGQQQRMAPQVSATGPTPRADRSRNGYGYQPVSPPTTSV